MAPEDRRAVSAKTRVDLWVMLCWIFSRRMTYEIWKKGTSICCHFIQICRHYVNKCSVRACCGLLPPVLNAVAEIVAEAGSAVLGLGVGTWAAQFANSFSLTVLSVRRGDVSSQGRDGGEGKPPAGATGGCLDSDASNMFQINPVLHSAPPSAPPTRIEHGNTRYISLGWNIIQIKWWTHSCSVVCIYSYINPPTKSRFFFFGCWWRIEW